MLCHKSHVKTIFVTKKWLTILNIAGKSSKLKGFGGFFLPLVITCAGIGDHCERLLLNRKSHWSELEKERKVEKQGPQVEKIQEVGCV